MNAEARSQSAEGRIGSTENRRQNLSDPCQGLLAINSRARRVLVLMGFCLLQSAFCLTANAQASAVDWHTIDGGGGTSTGGVYSISGTIGQPDAGPAMTGGQYTVTGGFWAWPQAVQTPGAPLLSITTAGPGFATISWTPDLPGFVLQETTSLLPTNWIDSASGTNNPTGVALTNAAKFYRLNKP